ncbi:MAG: hypothetical protein R3E66_23690 [bacterium]
MQLEQTVAHGVYSVPRGWHAKGFGVFLGCCRDRLASCGDDSGNPKGANNNASTNNVNNVNNITTNNGSNNGSNNGTSNNTTGGNNSANNTTNNLAPQRITLPLVGFRDPKVLYTADGVAHFTYCYGASPAHLVYGECAANCGVEDGWTFVELANSDLLNVAGLKSDASGRLHLVYGAGVVGVTTDKTIYSTCASGCTDANNWRTVDLTPALDGTTTLYDSPVAVSDGGGVYLITTDATIQARIILTQCLGNCEDGNNWSSAQIRTKGTRMSLVASGTALHSMMDNEIGGLVYRFCAGNCTNPGNWQESPQLFAFDGNGKARLDLANGELRVAYNQGQVSGQSPEVTAQNGRVLFWTCTSNCLDPAGWSGTLLANPDDGLNLDMATMGDATALAFASADMNYTLMVCLGNCLDPASWGAAAIDSSEEMASDFDPYAILCGGSSPYFAAWSVESPSMAISESTGEGLFASVGGLLQKCEVGGQYFRSTGMGRLTHLR